MNKMKMVTANNLKLNLEKLIDLFPNFVTEKSDNGKLSRAFDFDLFRQEFSDLLVEGQQERYQINWPGKRESLLIANAPIQKTLRPVRSVSVDFDQTKNIFIDGDNLDALKLLQESYLGKIKVIYIDPPYNTGEDFLYKDSFTEDSLSYFSKSAQIDELGNRLVLNQESNGRFHSEWLSMIYPRLKLARNLLCEDGIIFISIDDGEIENLKKIGVEIFGENNFLAVFIWEKRTSRENRKVFSTNHDYIVAFAKNRDEFQLQSGMLPYTEDVLKRYKNPDSDPRGDWQSVALSVQGGHGTKSQFYEIKTPAGNLISPPSGLCWRFTESKLNELISDNRIWFGAEGNNVPRLKLFLSEVEQGLTPNTLWTAKEVGTTDQGKREVNELFNGVSVFETPKPVSLLKRVLQVSSKEKDYLVMDFFAGSGSTAHAVMALNAEDGGSRRFISVQLPEACGQTTEAFKFGIKTISELSIDRIKRAGESIKKKTQSELSASKLDLGFRVFRVDTSNMTNVYYNPDAVSQDLLSDQADNVKSDRTPEDLLFQVLLDWGIDLSLAMQKETIQGKTVYFVDKNALAACFDSNGGIDEEFVKELAKKQPLRVVFRDAGFKSDSVKINVEQIFKMISPSTEFKCI